MPCASAPRRLIGSYFASLLGDFMVVAAMPFVVAGIGGGADAIGLVLATQAAAVVLALPAGGVVGDRVSRRTVMIAADLARFGSQAVLAVLLIAGDAALWQLVVAQAIHGLGTGIFMPAADAIVPEAVGPASIQSTNGMKQTAWSIAGIAGPALGATVIAVVGAGWAMAADAATFGLSALLVTGLPAAKPKARAAKATIWADLREGVTAFRERPWMAPVVLQWTLVNAVAIAPFFVLGPVLSQERFDGAEGWAIMLIALAIGECFGGLKSTSWKPGRPLVAALLLTTLWAVPLTLLAAGAPIGLVAVALTIAGFGLSTFDTFWRTTVHTEIPAEQRARVTSVDLFGSLAVVPFGFLLGAWFEEALGASTGLILGAVFMVVSTAVVLSFPSVRHLKPRAIEGDKGSALALGEDAEAAVGEAPRVTGARPEAA